MICLNGKITEICALCENWDSLLGPGGLGCGNVRMQGCWDVGVQGGRQGRQGCRVGGCRGLQDSGRQGCKGTGMQGCMDDGKYRGADMQGVGMQGIRGETECRDAGAHGYRDAVAQGCRIPGVQL